MFIDAFSPCKDDLVKGKDSIQTRQLYGRDVYQNVEIIQAYQEVAISSEAFTLEMLLQHGEKLLSAETKAFRRDHPTANQSELDAHMVEVKKGFRTVVAYLKAQPSSDATVQLRRSSGTRHKIRVKPNTSSDKVTFRSVVIAFGQDGIPLFETPKPKQSKGGNMSISTQYELSPSGFTFYVKFGIFEVYSKI